MEPTGSAIDATMQDAPAAPDTIASEALLQLVAASTAHPGQSGRGYQDMNTSEHHRNSCHVMLLCPVHAAV